MDCYFADSDAGYVAWANPVLHASWTIIILKWIILKKYKKSVNLTFWKR